MSPDGFTKWHREEISSPSAFRTSPLVTYRVMRISFTSVARGVVGSRVRGPYIFTLAHVSSPSSSSCSRCRCRRRFEVRERWGSRPRRRERIRPLSPVRYKSSSRRACRKKKWRYDDAFRYALCIRKRGGRALTENRFLLPWIREWSFPAYRGAPYCKIINLFTRKIKK